MAGKTIAKGPKQKQRVTGPITDYVGAAMCRAQYEILEDGTFGGHIPGIDGVWSAERTLEDCRDELQSALEDWIIISLVNGFAVPPFDGFRLYADKVH